MTSSAHQPSNQPGWMGGGVDDEGANRREEGKGRLRERRIRRDRGGRGERVGKGVLPSNMLALMAWTALTFNH